MRRPKESVCTSEAYMAAVRDLGLCVRCRRTCRPQFCHADEGKGQGLKTDVRRGWAGCRVCHWTVGTSGLLPKDERREEERHLARQTRRLLRNRGRWPKTVPPYPEDDTDVPTP